MNGADAARRRRRIQAIALAVLLGASALEIAAIAGDLPLLRDALLALIAFTMVVAALRG
jgi:hypothetical protein